MAFKIKESEPLGESIRRVACKEIDRAIDASRSARNGNGSPVHRTRKHLKKARAALRLLSSEVRPPVYRREVKRLRAVGRLISDIRDAEVRLETIKQMRSGVDGAITTTGGFRETEELLEFELDSFLAAFAGWQEEASQRLERARQAIGLWPLHGLTEAQVCRTVQKSYKRGRAALRCARKKKTASRFHELRKRAKELRYQLRLLRPLQPAVFGKMAEDLKTLGDQLGHAHDLSFVGQRLQGIGSEGKRASRALQAVIEAREKDLWRAALALAEHFYALKPRKFSAQLASNFSEREHARTCELREAATAA